MDTSQITMSVLAGTSSKIAESMVSYENDIALAVALEYKDANPAEFPMVKLGDLYEVPTIKHFNSGDMDNTGDSLFFNGKRDCPVGTHSEHSFTSDKDYFVMIKGVRDHPSNGMGKFFKVNGKCSITSHNVILVQKKENAITHEYVYYYMSLNATSLRREASISVNPKDRRGKKFRYIESISMGDIMDFPIHLPPLNIQEKIVATLSLIYNLNRKSEQMVADVKAQMVAIIESVKSRVFEMKKMEEIVTHDNGKSQSTEKKDKGEYRKGNTISIRKSDASDVIVDFHERKYWVRDCLIIIPKTSDCNIHYLYYYMKLNNNLITSTVGNTECNWDDIKDISVPIPPIEFQCSVVKRIRDLDSQQEKLIYLKRMSSNNARFIMEPYLPPQLLSKSNHSPLFTSFIF